MSRRVIHTTATAINPICLSLQTNNANQTMQCEEVLCVTIAWLLSTFGYGSVLLCECLPWKWWNSWFGSLNIFLITSIPHRFHNE